MRPIIVVTHAKVKPGQARAVADAFRAIQSGLFAGEKAFLGADLGFDRDKETAVLVTRWLSETAWRRFRDSRAVTGFLDRMSAHFAEPPSSWSAEIVVAVERGEGGAPRVAIGGMD